MKRTVEANVSGRWVVCGMADCGTRLAKVAAVSGDPADARVFGRAIRPTDSIPLAPLVNPQTSRHLAAQGEPSLAGVLFPPGWHHDRPSDSWRLSRRAESRRSRGDAVQDRRNPQDWHEGLTPDLRAAVEPGWFVSSFPVDAMCPGCGRRNVVEPVEDLRRLFGQLAPHEPPQLIVETVKDP